jgi:hypothetical protein
MFDNLSFKILSFYSISTLRLSVTWHSATRFSTKNRTTLPFCCRVSPKAAAIRKFLLWHTYLSGPLVVLNDSLDREDTSFQLMSSIFLGQPFEGIDILVQERVCLRWSSKHFWRKNPCKKSADLHPRQGNLLQRNIFTGLNKTSLNSTK